MIVLDTNVLSEVVRSRPAPGVVAWLEQVADDVAITTVTLAELLAAVRRLPDGRRRTTLASVIDTAVEPYRNTRSLLAFDEPATECYADILADRERSGTPISMADAQIASICRANGAACATRNVKDFAGTGVEVIDPWGS